MPTVSFAFSLKTGSTTMDGVFALCGFINDNVKVIAALALHNDKLLILDSVALYVIYKVHVTLRR